jgi:hypothetical protein
MDYQWTFNLKQAGVNREQCIDIYAVDERTLNSIDMEFYYAGDHIVDPLGIGKKYTSEDITQMLNDMEEFSVGENIDIDLHNVITEGIKWKQENEKEKETIYNILVAECMRGVIFNEIGDIINICVKNK